MKRILLYSPDVEGHPRVYCRVIADALAEKTCHLVIALGFTERVGLQESPDLLPLVSRPDVELLDTRLHSRSGNAHLTVEELIELQTRLTIDVTLFIEADKSKSEFVRIAKQLAPRLLGRNVGIFAATSSWYPGEDTYTGAPIRLLAPTLRTTLGNVKRAIFNRRQGLKFFYEKTIIGRGVLDEVWVKDERLADWYGHPVYWMPEISRPATPAETPEEAAEFTQRQAELGAFLTANAGREPVLYFGDAAYYKGYDLFLEFIVANPATCAIHPGRCYDPQQRAYFRSDVDVLRAQLRAEGRLYETNAYVHTQRLKELFFNTIRVYITTHRLALSSSTMIQAAELGKPVLVPDRGLLGHRVRTDHLGGVYRYEDIEDLRLQADALWRSDLSRFAEPVARFWSKFTDEAVKTFFVKRLLRS